MKEMWKDIKGYEGIYQISSFGRIKSLQRKDNRNHIRPEKILNPKVEKNGYRRVCLCKNGNIKRELVHRLVAEAYVDRKNEEDVIVNHLDNNPSNNRADNLEWTTYKGNMQWAAKQGRMPCNEQARINLAKSQKARRKSVIAIMPDGERVRFISQVEAGKQLGINPAHIAEACRKEYGYKRVKGYEFEYADPELQAAAKPKRKKMNPEVLRELQRVRMIGNKINIGRKPSEYNRKKSSEILSKPVIQYDKAMNYIAEYKSAKEAHEKTGITHISDVARGDRKAAGGYIWKWKEKV